MFRSILFISAVVVASCQSAESPSTTAASTNDSTLKNSTTGAAVNTLTDQEKSQGWELLFDGTSMNGWHVFNNKTDGTAWRVEDGCIHLDPKEQKDFVTVGGGDIVSANNYENFHLMIDWKLDSGGNSGIMFYVQEDPRFERTWHTGPEMQVLDNAHHKDAKITKHRSGDLYDLITSSPETVKPAGEWNHVEIISDQAKLELHQNGTKVVSTALWDDNWRQLIAGSKFKSIPEFGTFKSGKIALQDHGDRVWFRNIKVRKL